MKKFLPVLILSLLALGCSDEEVINQDIVGAWEFTMVPSENYYEALDGIDYIFISQIIFSEDGSYHKEEFVEDSETHEIIGYLSRHEGSYTIEESRIILNYDEYANFEDHQQQIVEKTKLNFFSTVSDKGRYYTFEGEILKLGCDYLENCDLANYVRIRL